MRYIYKMYYTITDMLALKNRGVNFEEATC